MILYCCLNSLLKFFQPYFVLSLHVFLKKEIMVSLEWTGSVFPGVLAISGRYVRFKISNFMKTFIWVLEESMVPLDVKVKFMHGIDTFRFIVIFSISKCALSNCSMYNWSVIRILGFLFCFQQQIHSCNMSPFDHW